MRRRRKRWERPRSEGRRGSLLGEGGDEGPETDTGGAAAAATGHLPPATFALHLDGRSIPAAGADKKHGPRRVISSICASHAR